jgi:hypothetical protein
VVGQLEVDLLHLGGEWLSGGAELVEDLWHLDVLGQNVTPEHLDALRSRGPDQRTQQSGAEPLPLQPVDNGDHRLRDAR